MKIYRDCPIRGPAKQAWLYFAKKNNEIPKAIWKMPNNFMYEYSVEKGGWGMWVAQYSSKEGEWKDYYDPTKPEKEKIRNVFSFIKKQSILDNAIDKLFGRK